MTAWPWTERGGEGGEERWVEGEGTLADLDSRSDYCSGCQVEALLGYPAERTHAFLSKVLYCVINLGLVPYQEWMYDHSIQLLRTLQQSITRWIQTELYT